MKLCLHCGYDMAGLRGGTCPECGFDSARMRVGKAVPRALAIVSAAVVLLYALGVLWLTALDSLAGSVYAVLTAPIPITGIVAGVVWVRHRSKPNYTGCRIALGVLAIVVTVNLLSIGIALWLDHL